MQNWSGTYSGGVRRAATAAALETGTSAEETWTVKHNTSTETISVVRERQGKEKCLLTGEHGGNGGGYGMTIKGTCTIDGRARTLQYGNLEYLSETHLLELHWGDSAEEITLYEKGSLTKS